MNPYSQQLAEHARKQKAQVTPDFARRLERERNQLRAALEHIVEYWNRDENEKAMSDALWHIIETAEDALANNPQILMKTKNTVTLDISEIDGNAFYLMRAFCHQARAEGWPQEKIDEVINDASSDDYNHLIQVLLEHCETPDIDLDNSTNSDENH